MGIKKDQKDLYELTQAAFIAVTLRRYEDELTHVVTDEDLEAFKIRWSKIADDLNEGWILNPEEL
jgi:hypothetical protein